MHIRKLCFPSCNQQLYRRDDSHDQRQSHQNKEVQKIGGVHAGIGKLCKHFVPGGIKLREQEIINCRRQGNQSSNEHGFEPVGRELSVQNPSHCTKNAGNSPNNDQIISMLPAQ